MAVDKEIRYGGRLACISDYANGIMGKRTDFSKEAILQAIYKLPQEREKKIEELWSTLCTNIKGIKNKDLEEYKYWKANYAETFYKRQQSEIEAAENLQRNLEANGLTFFDAAKIMQMPVWSFEHILSFRLRPDRELILAIQKLNYEYTFEELKVEWENTKNELR